MNTQAFSKIGATGAERHPMDSVTGASGWTSASHSGKDPTAVQVRKEIRQNARDFRALKHAINSNDLGAAQQAYANLQKDIAKVATANGGKGPFSADSPIGKDFEAIGTALQSGSLDAARQAFTSFRQGIHNADQMPRIEDAGETENDRDRDDARSGSGSSTPITHPSEFSLTPILNIMI